MKCKKKTDIYVVKLDSIIRVFFKTKKAIIFARKNFSFLDQYQSPIPYIDIEATEENLSNALGVFITNKFKVV